MADLDPIALATAIAEAQSKSQKPGAVSRVFTSIAGSDADPNIPSMIDANLGLPAAKSAQLTALFATTRSPDRIKAGISRIEPDSTFGEDDAGRLWAVMPVYRGGKKTGTFMRVYPNEPGLGLTEVMQAAGAVALATPVGRAIGAVGLPTAGLTGAAVVGGTEAALIEGASAGLTGAPYQVTDIPIGAIGGAAGQKLANVVGALASAARRSGPDRVLGPDGMLLPGPAEMVRKSGLDPNQVSAGVAAEIQRQVRQGIEPGAAGVSAMSRGLPVEVPMTSGQMTGSKGQQLAEDVMASGGYGRAAEQQMTSFREGQQEALRENIGQLTERLAPGAAPVAKGEGGRLAQEALVAARSGDKARADELYRSARASGAAVLEPDEALNFAEAARTTFREGYTPGTAPKMDKLLINLDEIMANGGDIKMLMEWRRKVTNLRKGIPTTDSVAASDVLGMFDQRLKDAVDNQLIIGDQAAVDAWQTAVRNYAEYAKTWKDKGGILNLLTEEVGRDGARQLKVAPESAANAIFTSTASGLAKKTNLPRDLLTLKSKLPAEQWNNLRQEAFIRLTQEAEGAFRAEERQVSGVKFKKAWNNLKRENPGVVNTLFSKDERDLITQFADVAARATNTAVNASNTANTAAGLIQRMAGAFRASGPGQFLIQNYLASIIREPYGAFRAAQQTSQTLSRATVPSAVGAGTGAALSQEESIAPNIPMTGRMTIGGQQ